MKNFARMIALATLIAGFAVANSAEAQGTYGNSYGNGYGFGLGWGMNGSDCVRPNHFAPFAVGAFPTPIRQEEPPYFAKFPPVYYSHIVARPYGYSPYATPPGIFPAEMMVAPVQAAVIKNPYVDQAELTPAAPTKPDNAQSPLVEESNGAK